MPHRHGSITLILIGLVSVMLLVLFALSRRLSGHTQLLTVVDSTQIARYFLESCSGDILSHVRMQVNKRDPAKGEADESEIYKAFRSSSAAGETALPMGGYKPCGLLTQMADELQIKLIGKPTVKMSALSPLPYPDMLQIGAAQKGREKKGFLVITCSAEFQKRKYTMTVRHPFRVVYRMVPMLREFVWFFDQIHLEQRTPYPPDDKINTLYLKAGLIEGRGNPWGLMADPPDCADVHKNGRIYFGDSTHNIMLNLGGENVDANSVWPYSDLWQVPPKAFRVNTQNTPFKSTPLFLTKNGDRSVNFWGMEIPLDVGQAKMGILGFSAELTADSEEGLFSASSWSLKDFLEADPSFQKLVQGEVKNLGMISSVRPRGFNLSDDFKGPNREIFGNVFMRFLLITFFDYVSAQGGSGPVIYNNDPGYRPTYKKFDTATDYAVTFTPKVGDYRNYMSQVVSAGHSNDEFRVSFNPDQPDKALNHTAFTPRDGLRVSKPFDQFATQYLTIDAKKTLDQTKSIQARITGYYPDQKSFEEAVGLKQGRFWVDGVVYVDGPLDLKNGLPAATDIHGGVILVNGKLTLGDIPRNWGDFTESDAATQKRISDRLKLNQDEFLTFVCLKDSILLTGDHHVGVQLACLKPGMTGAVDQIKWINGNNVIFYGGVAVSTPNMIERTRDFKRPVEMYYVPAMSDPNPGLAVSLSPSMGSYRMTVD